MAAFKVEAGSFLTQFNENEPVTPLATSLALWRIQYNPARFYKKTYFLADHKTELANGLLLSSRLMYARRQELSNEPSLRHYNQYDANNVISDRFQQPDAYIAMPTHNTLQLWLSLEIRFQQEYLSHPLTKYVTEESKWPIITLQYKKGIPNIFNSASNFDFVGANARYRYDMGLLGHTDFLAEYGHFVNTKHIAFPDFKHFMGNRVLIHPAQQNSFLNLPYYAYSTANAYTEFHVAHRFKGFLLNKLPLIRKLHWHELVAVNYVSAPKSQKDAYIEWLVGVENVFKILSVEWGQSYIGGKYAGQRLCFRVGFSN
jgi:hypothetical protein